MTRIERDLEFRLMASPNVMGGHGTIHVSYNSTEPWTIHLQIPTYEWRVDRDLIAEGCLNDAGDGDVYVQVGEDGIYFHLRDQAGGEAILVFDRNDLVDFLDATWKLVERGTETIDLDGELDELLGRAS